MCDDTDLEERIREETEAVRREMAKLGAFEIVPAGQETRSQLTEFAHDLGTPRLEAFEASRTLDFKDWRVKKTAAKPYQFKPKPQAVPPQAVELTEAPKPRVSLREILEPPYTNW